MHFPEDRQRPVLDVGCGAGDLVAEARVAGYANVRGVDRSPSQVAEAHRRGVDSVEAGDAIEALRKSPPASLSAIVAFDVLEHLDRPAQLTFVDEVARVLTPDGRLILHVPNAESPFFGRIRYGDLTHETAFTRGSLAQLLRQAGFVRVDCHEDAPIVHGLKSLVRRAVWSGVRAAFAVALTAETGERPGSFVFSQNMLVVASR